MLDSQIVGYSIIIEVTFSVINIEQISFEHRIAYSQSPVFSITIKNDGSCRYTGIKNVEKIGNYTGTMSIKEYYIAATAIRKQILMIPGTYHDSKIDSTIIVIYTENKNTKVFAGRADDIEYNYFWTIDAIINKIVKEVNWINEVKE